MILIATPLISGSFVRDVSGLVFLVRRNQPDPVWILFDLEKLQRALAVHERHHD